MNEWLILAGLGVAGGLLSLAGYAVERFSIEGRTRRAARDLRPTAIGEVADGATIKITGRVRRAKEVLTAPFSERRCCFYIASCYDDGSFDHQGVGGYNQVSQQRGCDFFVEDDTGKALIRVDERTQVLARPKLLPSVPNELIKAFVESRGYSYENPKPWHPEEWTLSKGQLVTVFGLARWEHDPEPGNAERRGYRDAPRRLVLSAPPSLHLLIDATSGSAS